MSKPYVCRIVVQMKKHSQNGKICYEKRLNKDVGGKVVILCVNNKELVISLRIGAQSIVHFTAQTQVP